MFTSNFSNHLDDQLTTQLTTQGDESMSQQPLLQKTTATFEEDYSQTFTNLLSSLGAEAAQEPFENLSSCPKIFNNNFNISEALTNLYAKVSEASYITRYDRELIKLTLLQENLKEEEHRIINRLLYSIRRGWIELVDDVHSALVFDQSRKFCRD